MSEPIFYENTTKKILLKSNGLIIQYRKNSEYSYQDGLTIIDMNSYRKQSIKIKDINTFIQDLIKMKEAIGE